MGIRKLLTQHKTYFMTGMVQWFRINRMRLHAHVGRNCIIQKKIHYGTNLRLGNYVRLLGGVKIGNDVKIGSNARLSKIEIGDQSHIETGVIITGCGSGRITVGRQSYIGPNNILDWSDHIIIGDYVHIAGPSTGLWTHSSVKQALDGVPLGDKDTKHRPTAPIYIGHYAYIGGNCTIYPGVTIGHNAVVAPNSAVDKDVAPYTLVGGVPAKYIKKIEISK